MDLLKSKLYEKIDCSCAHESKIADGSCDYNGKFESNCWNNNKRWCVRKGVVVSLVIMLLISIVGNGSLIGVIVKYSDTWTSADCVADSDPQVCRSCADLEVSDDGGRSSGAPWHRACGAADWCCMAIPQPLVDVVTLRDASGKYSKTLDKHSRQYGVNTENDNRQDDAAGRVDTVDDTDTTDDGDSSTTAVTAGGTRPGAHLVLNVTALAAIPGSLAWTTEGETGMTFLLDVQLLDHSIVIRVPGLYYIYSFITFVSETASGRGMFNHYIYRGIGAVDNVGVQLLQMDKQTKRAGHNHYQTSWLAGVFRLKRGDIIMSAVSDVSDVYKSAFSNFFGLFML